VDAFAALVPAEVLTLHALILPVTTNTVKATTEITQPGTLYWAFFGLLLLSVVLYAAPRLVARKWDRLDYLRTAIPPLAFVGWTMLQRATAFDAVFPNLAEAPRTVGALFLGVVLGLVAVALAYKADQKNP
jgi:drug/metabolite transporter (DMT)-like permease